MIRLVFGIHIHQPVGNFDEVFETAYDRCYLPFLKAIINHPSFKFCLHCSGSLLQWIEQKKPEWFEILRRTIAAGQVEMMGGGFYEPILSVIPDEDRMGQILKMSHYIQEKFGVVPTGMWTAERIWEPGLPTTMAESGMTYTVLDDTHFRWAGLKDDELHGYYITEDNGMPVNVFPISKFLRYSIPFKSPQVTIDYLKKLYDRRGDIVVVYADDGEKFGLWPGTYRTCYDERWLERFFFEVTKNMGWIKPVFFTEAISEVPALGRIYLPTASYAEMGQWALPPDGFSEYDEIVSKLKSENLWDHYGYLVRGGFWRNFMSKYPEVNNMHKKMLHVTLMARKAMEDKDPDKKLLSQAIDLKWQGQCNCAYWHGVFGGVYLNHLRNAVYSRFLAAEALIDSKKDRNFLEYDVFDFDMDGRDEIILRNRNINLYLSPSYGGSLFELDYKPSAINLLDTMTRRKEGYHARVAQAARFGASEGSIHERAEVREEGLEKFIVYDWHRRLSFLDHFFEPGTTVERFARNDYAEKGDFVNQPFQAALDPQEGKLVVQMGREGHVWINNIWAMIVLVKKLTFLPDTSGFGIKYHLENRSGAVLSSYFGIETAWALMAGNVADRFYHIDGRRLDASAMVSTGVTVGSDRLGLRDEYLKYDVVLRADRKVDWWRFPIETVSLSEKGFEKNYQQSTVMPVVALDLAPGGSFDLSISVEINKIE